MSGGNDRDNFYGQARIRVAYVLTGLAGAVAIINTAQGRPIELGICTLFVASAAVLLGVEYIKGRLP